MQIEVKFGM